MTRWTRMVSRITHLLAAAALAVGVGLASTTAAQVSDQPSAVSAYTLTPERIAASTAAVVALIGAVIGGLALARSARPYRFRQRATRSHRRPCSRADRSSHRWAGRGDCRRRSRHR